MQMFGGIGEESLSVARHLVIKTSEGLRGKITKPRANKALKEQDKI